MKTSPTSALLSSVLLLLVACASAPDGRQAVVGDSPLVARMNEAAAELDIPAEILAGVAWSETALRDHSRDFSRAADGHGPRSAGVMGLPEHGRVRSIARAAELLGTSASAVVYDPATNIRGAAAILRDLADRTYGPGALVASGDRDRWLEVVARYFDAGATGEKLALEVRRTIARGLVTSDDEGRRFEIRSFAALYGLEAPGRTGTSHQAVAGEYPSSTWVAASSQNYTNASRTGADIDVIVIHTTQGSYAGAISWFQDPAAQVSAHYVVRRSDGDVTQMVHHADIAWHAGNWSYNQRSIGIEHEGYIDDPNTYTQAMYRASADLSRWLCDNLGIPKDRSHIIGHIEVPSATHTDPGQYWDWNLYMSLVTSGSAPSTGTLKGVVFVAGDTTNRIAGARVAVSPGGQTATVPANGYFEFSLPPGDYTVTASADGYDSGSVTRTVTAGQETWGSVGLSAGTATGVYRGVVYDARAADLSVHLSGARVRLSTGDEVTTDADGAFAFTVVPGSYTATAELSGWQPGSTTRTIAAGQTEWGSIGLMPAEVVTNQPPKTPVEACPIQGAEVVSVTPVFTAAELGDPEGGALTLDVEIYADEALTARVSTVEVALPAATAIASWRHPGQDLPRGMLLYWRTRAKDADGATSPWSAPQAFLMADDGTTSAPSVSAWTATLLPGVGSDTAPGAPSIQAPADQEVAETLHPAVEVGAAMDAEADHLAYEVQVSTDDLFEVVVARSPLVPEGGPTRWSVTQKLVAGARYYVRARAADDRLFGPWSASSTFTIDPKVGAGGELKAAVSKDSGGCAAAGRPDGWLPLGVVLLGLALARRRA